MLRHIHKFVVVVQILGIILGICCIFVATDLIKNRDMYSNQKYTGRNYEQVIEEKNPENYNLIFYKKGCPYCKAAQKDILTYQKGSKYITIFIDVDSKVGRNLVSAYDVKKAATAITFRNGRVNKYLYTKKVEGKYQSKKNILEKVFKE